MPPFFDPNWPTSLNYGGLGVVAGHELSHAFDDQGVQWSGDGTLSDWMKNQSKTVFNEAANCIINEYHNFCPLKGTGMQPECLNGENTQGENIADNGGNRFEKAEVSVGENWQLLITALCRVLNSIENLI